MTWDWWLNAKIAECEEREQKALRIVDRKGITDMGGKPKTSTPADKRLKENNPNAGKSKQPKKGGK